MLEHILFFTMNDGILKASKDQMKTAICLKPSPGQLLLAEHEARFPQPAHLSSRHSRGHCTQTHAAFSRRSSSFQFAGPQRSLSLCLAHALLFPFQGPPRGNLTAHSDMFPHCSLSRLRSFQHPLTRLRMYLLNDYGFKSILPTILHV